MEFYYLVSNEVNPYLNLSVEEFLLNDLPKDSCVFYLWQNDKTVVIGKNQEAAAECDLTTMAKEGITLARRCTGGGAVYHDLGNLNFSFIFPNETYDVKRQLEVIITALSNLGITAEISGRNDITVGDAKISGNAFITRKSHSLHHGTLLVDTDFSAMAKCLTPSIYKLRKKTIASVASRVINLSSIKAITVDQLKEALSAAFEKAYSCELKELTGEINSFAYLAKHQDDAYLLGEKNLMTEVIEGLFDECYYKFAFNIENGRITDILIYTDSLATDVERLLDLLPGKNSEEIAAVLREFFSAVATDDLQGKIAAALLAKTDDFS